MSTQKHCPGCGTAVSPGQPFCPRCGKELSGLFGRESGPISATGTAPQGGPTRPWPFSNEVLAAQLAMLNIVPKHVVDGLMAEVATSGRSLPALVLERRALTEVALRDAMSRIFGLPVADLRSLDIDPALIASFPSEMARRHMFLPLHREDTRLLMVVADPTQAQAVREVKNTLRLTIDMRLATPSELAPIVHQYFSPTLVVLLPSGETFTVPVPSGEIKIGKADHNDIVLPDPAVSGTHGVLRALGSEYQIVDLGSRNGIFVDNVRIEGSRALKNGDVVTIGQCLLTFKLPVPEAAASDAGSTQILMPGQLPSALHAGRPGGSSQPVVTPVAVPVVVPPAPDADDKGDKKKKKKKEKAKDSEKLKSAWIGFVGRIVAQIVGAIATIILGLAVAGKLDCGPAQGNGSTSTPAGSSTAAPALAAPVLFGETNAATGMEYNASGVVPLADSRFLFVENNTNDALFELAIGPDGARSGPLVRHPIVGLAAGAVDDMEGLTLVEANGTRYLVATASMMKKVKKGADATPPSALVRMTVREDGTLAAEAITDLRGWFLKNVPAIAAAADAEPDQGGLNVEGLAWDPKRGALLFGVRTPLDGGKPMVIPVRIKDPAGAWDPSNLEPLAPIRLDVDGQGDRGVRSIEYDPSRQAFLVMVGNATSASKAPFQLYLWDGGDSGAVRRLSGISFDGKMKPEGVTHGTVGGKGAVVVTDDGGGYVVIFDERLE